MAGRSKKSRGFENRAVLYLRYSTHNQTDLSIEYQREKATEYCEKAGYIIVKSFIDEARSGTTDKREAFQQMIEEATDNPTWSKVIVFSFNRFARNKDFDGYYKVVLMQHGITVESATEDNSDTPEARLTRNISASYDAYMPERCAVHTHASMMTKAQKGLHCGGKPPLGYDIKDEKLVINKYEAETVKLIFDMYDKNYSYNAMLKVLNEQGRTTKRGAPFKKTSFNSILQQEKYKGVFVWNRAAHKGIDDTHNNHESKPLEEQVRIKGGCKAIIDAELFDRVQKKMRANRHKNLRTGSKNHYMLGGLGKVYCAECGSRMVGAANKSHDETYLYYTCPQHKQKNCKTKDLRASYLEHHLSAHIVNLILNKNNYASYNLLIQEVFSKHSNAGLKKELNGISKAIDNILKVLEIQPTDEAAERLALLSAKKAAVQKKMTAVNNTPQITPGNLKEVRKSFYHLLKESSDPVIYDILDKLIEKITVSNDGVEIELNI